MSEVAAKTNQGVDIISEHIGKIIRRHRQWKKLSQRKMAELADISGPYVTAIESGRYDPNIKTLAKIAKALDVPLWQIIKEAEELDEDGE